MTRASAFTAVVVAGVLVAACSDPAKDKPKAQVGAPVAQAPAPAVDAMVTYNVLPATSKIEWTGSKVTGKHDGGFTQFKGTVQVPAGKVQGARIAVEIQTDSLVSEPDKLVTHLKSPDFFDVQKFPTATFESTTIDAGDSPTAFTITGNLTLHGVTKSIQFPAKVTATDAALQATAEFVINRKDFGLVYPGMPDDLIRDDVVIRLNLNAPK